MLNRKVFSYFIPERIQRNVRRSQFCRHTDPCL